MKTADNLILALNEYIKLLSAELDDVVGMASIHGWKSNRYKEGELQRSNIKVILEEYASQPKDIPPTPVTDKPFTEDSIRDIMDNSDDGNSFSLRHMTEAINEKAIEWAANYVFYNHHKTK